MTSKPIPGRRRFLQAFAALPLAGVAGAELIKGEIAKAAMGKPPGINLGSLSSTKWSDTDTDTDTDVGGGSVKYLKRLLSDRNSLSERRREDSERRNGYECGDVDALRSISPSASRRIMNQRQSDVNFRDVTTRLDREIAELRKRIDPLDLIGLVSDAT